MQTGTQQLTRWRFTVHDYHRMGEAGILRATALPGLTPSVDEVLG